MKKVLLLLLLFFALKDIRAQVVIPDTNFRAYLVLNYPGCMTDSILDTSCAQVMGALEFNVSQRNIRSLEGIQYFPDLQTLYCYSNLLTSLPPLPHKIVSLYCENNQLTSLPALPDSLRLLSCAENQLSSFPALPSRIFLINFIDNNITSLPPLPPLLESLIGRNNPLTSLPALPGILKRLDISNGNLTTLPPLPASLQEMFVDKNHLTVLPELPSSLYSLGCRHNQLTSLPALSPALTWIDCSENFLTSLPSLPPVLQVLECSYNQLSALPPLSESMVTLNCDNNYLTALPAFPGTFQELFCMNNLLNALPALPAGLTVFNATYNPLACLPPLPSQIREYYITHTNITCIPNLVFPVNTDTTLPLCINPADICAVHPFVQGRIYLDSNSNGTFDSLSEHTIENQVVAVSPNGWIGNSHADGSYFVALNATINNTWRCVSSSPYVLFSPSSYSLTPFTQGVIHGNYDFGVHIIPGVYDLQAAIGATAARPGFTTISTLTVNNVGTLDQSGITVQLKKPGGLTLVVSDPPPDIISGDTLTWTENSINTFNSKSFNLLFQVPANVTLGTEIIYEVWATGSPADSTIADNYAKWTDTIHGSFDPNDKKVNRSTLPAVYDTANDRLIYTIRFQNTGTYAAEFVMIRDIIPSQLDISSLQVVNASHPYQLTLRDKNIVEITFPNIQLPDSNANEALSHGFVQLSFRPKTGLPVNTQINNKASIFFDYNAPAVTNTATTKVRIVTGIANNKKLDFKLFPNPAMESITVKLPHATSVKWQICDLNGKMIKKDFVALSAESFQIDVTNIAAGTYILSVEMDGEISAAKIMIVR